jgi:hypothetical protein
MSGGSQSTGASTSAAGSERIASVVSAAGDSTRSDDGGSSAAGGWMVWTPGILGTDRTRIRVTLPVESATLGNSPVYITSTAARIAFSAVFRSSEGLFSIRGPGCV